MLQRHSFPKLKYSRRSIIFIIIFALILSNISADISLYSGIGMDNLLYSLDNGISYPLDSFTKPAGCSARVGISHDINNWFSYGGQYRFEYNAVKSNVYTGVYSSDILADCIFHIECSESFAIPFVFSIGGHFEALGNYVAYGMSLFLETGLEWFVDDHNVLRILTGAGSRFQWIRGNDSYTFTAYPFSLIYAYCF